MKKIIVLSALLLVVQLSSASRRINGTEWNSPMSRVWNYEDQTIAAEGEFLKAVDGKVLVDVIDSIVLLNIHELHWEDRKYVAERAKKEIGLAELRARHTKAFVDKTDIQYEARAELPGYSRWIAILMFVITCLMLITRYKRRLNEQ